MELLTHSKNPRELLARQEAPFRDAERYRGVRPRFGMAPGTYPALRLVNCVASRIDIHPGIVGQDEAESTTVEDACRAARATKQPSVAFDPGREAAGRSSYG